jgi:anaerobic selenocysteine-containing dehydrogenase
MKKVITTCALDCPDNCGMIATIENGRLSRLEGNPEHGYTRGYLCKKGYHYPDRVYSSNRVLYPQKKVEGKWQRISWSEALDTIAEKIEFFQKTYGDSSIMHYQRSSSWGASKHLVKRFFNLLGDVTTQSGSLCAGSVMAAQKADMGARLGNDPEDFVNSKTIIIWGKDPFKSTIHVIPILKEARKRGARIVAIDPIRTESASFADEHIAPRPGSDGYLAIGIAQYLLKMGFVDTDFIRGHTIGYDQYLSVIQSFSMEQIEQKCDVEARMIENLARIYGERKPSSILLGYGINKWVHSPEMIRFIDALGALTGNIGVKGGGVNHGFQTKRHFDPRIITPRSVKYKREIPEPLLGRGILEAENPPIKMIWINGTNPVASCPDSNTVIKALKSLDFTVVVDHFMTDTADLADIFLPTTTFLEEEDIVVSWGHNWIGPVNKAIEPLGETKSDLQIVIDLSKRLGLENEMAGTPRKWLKRLMQPMESAGLSVGRVMESPVRCPIAPMVAFQDRKFLTPSGKFELIDQFYEEHDDLYAFHLLTILSKEWLNSLVLEEDHPEIPKALIHPVVAQKRGIAEKSRAVLKSAVGELIVEAHFSEGIRKDTIAISHGTWIKKGGGVNQLTEAFISTSGKMAAYYSSTVNIEPLNP